MPPVGFEPTISAGERSQTYALDRAATGSGLNKNMRGKIYQQDGLKLCTLGSKPILSQNILKPPISKFIWRPKYYREIIEHGQEY